MKYHVNNSGTWSNPATVRIADSSSWRMPVNDPVTVVGANGRTTNNTGATGVTLSAVSGIAPGDLAIVACAYTHDNQTTTMPSGWTQLTYSSSGWQRVIDVYYRFLDGSETWPITIHSSVTGTGGWTVSQTIFRNTATTAPLVTQTNHGGYNTRQLSSGVVQPVKAGGYCLLMTEAITSETSAECPNMTMLHQYRIGGGLFNTGGYKIKNTKSLGFEMRYQANVTHCVAASIVIDPA